MNEMVTDGHHKPLLEGDDSDTLSSGHELNEQNDNMS